MRGKQVEIIASLQVYPPCPYFEGPNQSLEHTEIEELGWKVRTVWGRTRSHTRADSRREQRLRRLEGRDSSFGKYTYHSTQTCQALG